MPRRSPPSRRPRRRRFRAATSQYPSLRKIFDAYGKYLSPACADMCALRLEHLVQLAQMYLSRTAELDGVNPAALSSELLAQRDEIVATLVPGLDLLAHVASQAK